ncbi:GAF and ANTAR domain-containing protein [Streptomyces sp. NPDC001046]|uniref:GAF and ANTAR domain-containing protein n=1 Tax=unclassified Streptomyces TaxID=2593676 RepID=UPI00368EDC5B
MTVDWQRYAEQMAQLARDLLAQDSVQATLDRIAASAVKLIEGCDAAGILAVSGGRAVTLAVTGDLVAESDRLQGELREGPCFDAARRMDGQRLFRIADMTRPQPAWPAFSEAARGLGIGSMTGVLLYTDEEDFGALNLYSRRPGAFGEDIEGAGWLLASHAAVALSAARTVDRLENALETRHAVGEAIGILMERHGLGREQAFDALRRLSRQHDIELHQVAGRVRGGPAGPR